MYEPPPPALRAYLRRIDQVVVVGEIYTTVADTLFPRALTRRHYCTFPSLTLPRPSSRSYPPVLEPTVGNCSTSPDNGSSRLRTCRWKEKIRPPAGLAKAWISLRGCMLLLLVLCRRGSRFRIARFHRTIVARDEQLAILLAANVFAWNTKKKWFSFSRIISREHRDDFYAKLGRNRKVHLCCNKKIYKEKMQEICGIRECKNFYFFLLGTKYIFRSCYFSLSYINYSVRIHCF